MPCISSSSTQLKQLLVMVSLSPKKTVYMSGPRSKNMTIPRLRSTISQVHFTINHCLFGAGIEAATL